MNKFHAKKTVIAMSLGLMMASTSFVFAQNADVKNNGLVISSLEAPTPTQNTSYEVVRTNEESNSIAPSTQETHASAITYVDSSRFSGKLVQIGEPNGNLQPLKGFAKDLPLITVLKQITPNGWVVKKNDSANKKLDTQQLVSWEGGKSWIETLGDISRQYNVNTLVNWKEKEITLAPVVISNVAKVEESVKKEEVRISPQANLPAPKTGIFELAGETTNVTVGSSQATETVSAPVATPVAVSSWTLDSRKSLKENVEAWGKVAGYKVVWTGEDYPVDENRGLAGEFDGDNGPIKQLSLDYGPKSRVQQPLTFQFFQNRTLVIENYKFEQQGFAQYSQ